MDYERVRGWTKRSRLPAGKSSIFEMRKLFIPVNQGNIHWVLVVVDMGGSGSAGWDAGGCGEGNAKGSFKVNFFDSIGRDGALYVQVKTFLRCTIEIQQAWYLGVGTPI